VKVEDRPDPEDWDDEDEEFEVWTKEDMDSMHDDIVIVYAMYPWAKPNIKNQVRVDN